MLAYIVTKSLNVQGTNDSMLSATQCNILTEHPSQGCLYLDVREKLVCCVLWTFLGLQFQNGDFNECLYTSIHHMTGSSTYRTTD